MANSGDTKILFIINPIAGDKEKGNLEKQITQLFSQGFQYELAYTERRNHATELSKSALGKFDIVVAVGGDGTVNEIGQPLIGSNTALGIIPYGSGNGFARHLQLPLNSQEALQIIANNYQLETDTITVNDMAFFNVAGIGFDALIGHKFAIYGKRGFLPYFNLVVKEFYQYRPVYYKLWIDNKFYHRKAFLISFANSSQFGFNAHISPNSKINDGHFEVCFIKKFPKWKAGRLALRLFSQTIHESPYTEVIRAQKVEIKQAGSIPVHFDGEPAMFDNSVQMKINPKSLKIIVPKKFNG